jgi:hypothetical protein
MQEIDRVVAPLLSKLGFEKRTRGLFTIDIAEGVLGRVGLNRATQHRPPGEAEINPVIGVRHQGVERLVAELRGEKFHPYLPSTVSTPLGYLFPEARYRSWVFGRGPIEPIAREMVAAIAEYGLPFMRLTAAMPELCRRLEEGLGIEHQLAYRRPVAWLLAGNPRRATDVLADELGQLGDRTDPAAEELRRFGDALRMRLAQAS